MCESEENEGNQWKLLLDEAWKSIHRKPFSLQPSGTLIKTKSSNEEALTPVLSPVLEL